MSDVELVVIDGDSLSFVACCASEQRTISVVERSTNEEHEFKNRTEFKNWCTMYNKDIADFDVKDVQTPEPLANTLHTMKMMIKGNCDKLNCYNYVVVLSGDNNFRELLPLPTKYKANREGKIKPLNLIKSQQYLINNHAGEVVDGTEADDRQAMYQFKGYKEKRKIVVVSIDKDAKQTPGWLFNPDKMEEPVFIDGFGELYKDSKGDIDGFGRKWLYFQILFGDPVDDYKPCELAIDDKGKNVKYGQVAAYNDLKDCQTDKECWQAIVDRYRTWYPEEVHYYVHGDVSQPRKTNWLELLQMYTDCAHMRRWPGDRIIVSELLEKLDVRT